MRTWLITGAGRGLGRAFAQAALEAGDQVVATVRDPAALPERDRLRVLTLDVRDRAAVFAAVEEAWAAFGGLDVVVNNAGYGLVGGAEEVSEADARGQLDVNLLGPLWVCQAVLPHLRAQGSGHIVQVSTTGAVGTVPLLGLYNASKWGLEGFSEALAAEVAGFGVRVTIAELGGFGTDWGGSSMAFATPNRDYDPLRTALFGTAEVPWPVPEEATGEPDPRAAAAALLAHVDAESGPLRLIVGDDAPEHIALALETRRQDYTRDPRFTWPA
ncbi:SDR family NAD(P)-dependent oxidoreductase [Solirubrobacter phytolaccae]|uniref:SDR family NAD(P)-dependent oxidoreductase n=1 Tax=Solirubrobacter phytolaccae TaxID=1404360 RepID=A0A9X3N592_9ACTN|nr:SDR family NAD(P)-dependent oxidoreductase [Solirubrobacter phytolaccae]MDA0179978.1 SDR family NAD(P)-dependent oxidoreductase [Solirubrobacter phytolaccae]